MRPPPGAPITSWTCPFFITMVGAIVVLRMRHGMRVGALMFWSVKRGLGIEIDERVADKYPFLPGPWSLFRIDRPPQTVAVTGDHSIKWV